MSNGIHLVDLLKTSFSKPKEAATVIISRGFSYDVIWSVFVATICLTTAMQFFADGLMKVDEDIGGIKHFHHFEGSVFFLAFRCALQENSVQIGFKKAFILQTCLDVTQHQSDSSTVTGLSIGKFLSHLRHGRQTSRFIAVGDATENHMFGVLTEIKMETPIDGATVVDLESTEYVQIGLGLAHELSRF